VLPRHPLLAVFLAFTLHTSTAAAYCRTTTCDPMAAGSTCEEEANNPGCIITGKALQWPLSCVGVALHEGASSQVNYSEFERVARASFGSWNNVLCDGKAPSIATEIVGPISCKAREFNDDKGNANIVLFREDTWPYAGQSSVLALTTLTFGVESGTIYDADMEINAVPGKVKITTGDTGVAIDLQSIITHEAGHLLGLAHSSVKGTTMTAVYLPGTTDFRSLEPDDEAGLCAAYPADRSGLPACDPRGPTPRSQGFSQVCGGTDKVAPVDDSQDSGCQCSAAGPPGPPAGWLLGPVAWLAARRRRRAT